MADLARFGLMFEPQEGLTVDGLLGWAEYAERSGYGYFFRSDHILPTSGLRGLPSPECWTSLAAIGARTSAIRFGPMVTPIGFRNPALLARMACTVHSFTQGRLQFAVGTGWYKDEYVAHGYEFPDFKTRKGQFREALQIMVPLVRGQRVDFDGKHYSAHTDCLPKPVGHVNVIIGGRSKAVARMAVEFADELNMVHPTEEALSSLKPIVQAKEGLSLSMMGPFLLAPDAASLESSLKRWIARRGVSDGPDAFKKRLVSNGVLVGTPGEFASQLRERMDWGLEKFYFQVIHPEDRQMVELLTETLKGVS